MQHTHRFAMVCPQRSLSAELLLQELAERLPFDPHLYSPSSLIERSPDAEILVVLNYSLENPSTRELVRLIETNFPQYKMFLLLEQLGSPELFVPIQRLVGVASQQYSMPLIMKGFERVMQGGCWLPRGVMERLLAQQARPAPHPDLSRLSNKEAAVVEQLSAGLTNEAIARKLGVSTNTVKTHLQSVYRKLGVGNRTEALARMSA